MKGMMFKEPMLRALLAHRKTETRRLMDPQPVYHPNYQTPAMSAPMACWTWTPRKNETWYAWEHSNFTFDVMIGHRARYRPGDDIFAKEPWAICSFSANFAKDCQLQVAYKTGIKDIDHPEGMTHDLEWRTVDYETWEKYATQKYYSWQSPMFMPEFAGRIKRHMIEVRAERVQAITEEAALAEGMSQHLATQLGLSVPESEEEFNLTAARRTYRQLWDQINKKVVFASNPWVWVYQFIEEKE